MTDRLLQMNAEVVNSNMADIHETGHGMQDDMKMMFDMIKPKNVMPIHGFLTMRYQNKKNMVKWGMRAENIHLTEDGQTWTIDRPNGEVKRSTKIESKPILIDALGYADSGDVVIKDRQKLAEFGVLCVILDLDEKTKALQGNPNFIARGFVNLSKEDKYKKSLDTTVREIHKSWYETSKKNNKWDEAELRESMERRLGKMILKGIDRDPIILTILV
jgi:ribonuclease J